MGIFEPGYLALYRSGELERRAEALNARLASCDICPRKCGVNRLKDERGFCHSGNQPLVSSFCAHHGEEPALSGTKGSGTIFFGNCNMRCVYCQNFQISQDPEHQESGRIDCRDLAEKMLSLQNNLGCHNINLVSPTHFVPRIVQALSIAVPLGLHLPLVYNTGGYESVETLRQLEGIIDIYLPDLRYASDECAVKYSAASDYVASARAAIREMYRQVGDLHVDNEEIAYRGLIVRHLILPNDLAGSEDSLTWLAHELSPSVTISIMSQYYPTHKAIRYPLLSRGISWAEYGEVAGLLDHLGLENGWLQEMDAPSNYLPDFSRQGHPFEWTEESQK
jgi:putative pyruvate formate lyase activating enzyme